METILAIETCVPEASLALWRGGELVARRGFASDRGHNSMVFVALDEVLKELGDDSLDLVIVGTGPGSYSGTRIGIATGQGVAIAHGCPAVGIGSFAATPEARTNEVAMAAGDARRGVYFISRIAGNGEAMPVELMDAGEFQKILQAEEDAVIFTFDPPDSLGLDDVLAARVLQTRPEAPYLVDVWRSLDASRKQELMASPLTPTYLRAPFTSKAKPGHPLLR